MGLNRTCPDPDQLAPTPSRARVWLVLGVVTANLFVAPGYAHDNDQVRTLTFHSLVLSVMALIFVDRSMSSSIITAITRQNCALAVACPSWLCCWP